jgi:hypothetical protein
MSFKLTTGDGKTIEARKEAVLKSDMINQLLEVADAGEAITLDFIHSEDLQLIVDYCEYHAKTEDGTTKATEADIQKHDQELLKEMTKDNDQHIRMLVNADKLIIHSLFQLLVRALVAKMHNLTSEEIRKEFKITNDLGEEEAKEVLDSTSWLYAKEK